MGRKRMKVSVTFLILGLLILLLEANPGIKVKITQKALDYGNQFGIELLKQNLKEKIFEDWNGESTHAFFALNYTISKIRIENMEFPNTSLSLISGTGIKLSVENASAMAHADWSVETWLFKDSGSGAVFISGISLTAIVKVSQNVFGHLKLSLDSCKGDIDDMDIKLSQSYRLLYTYSTASVVTSLCSMLASNLCQQVNCVIQKINKNFNQYPVQVQIGHFAVIDYSLINSSTILESSIDLDLKGTVRPVEETTEPPFKPTPFVLLNENNSMFYIGISEYFLQSASLAYYISGAFTISAEQEEMLSSYFKLTTDTLNSIIPTISHIYAKPLPVIMNIRIIDAPVISLHDHKSILVFSASMEVLAKMPNSTTESMFTLNVTTKTHADLTIFDRTLLTTLCLNSFHISLAHSNVGLFEASLLDNFLSYILRTGIIPAANFELKDGFPLPVLDTMILMKPNIRIYESNLEARANLKSEIFEARNRKTLSSNHTLGKKADWMTLCQSHSQPNSPHRVVVVWKRGGKIIRSAPLSCLPSYGFTPTYRRVKMDCHEPDVDQKQNSLTSAKILLHIFKICLGINAQT